MSLLSYFRREPPLYQTDNLFNYIKAYPSRVADEAREALQGISDPITRMSSAAQLITSPIAPASEDLFSQLGQFAAPGINRHQQAMIDAQNQLAERLNLPTQDYTPMSGEQVSQQLAMLGSLMRGKFPNWVSPSQIAIRGFQPKATGQQYAKALEKEKGAITEARETGLLKALQETPGTITQEQALSLVSPLELTETIRGGRLPPVNVDSPYAIPEVLSIGRRSNPTELETVLANDYDAYSALESQFPDLMEKEDWGEIVIRDVFGVTDYTDTKYGRDENLNLPGGTNEKEILVQLPYPTTYDFDSYEAYNEAVRSQNQGSGAYIEGHWDEPNVLAHIRTNERDVGGRKALHLEEIQSDWHQQGQKKGYQLSKREIDSLNAELKKVEDEVSAQGFDATQEQQSRWIAAKEKLRATAVPDAPFKKNWHELGWKRAFMEALRDPSIERLTWTTGDVQADRYNLAKYINAIDARPNPNGTFQLAVRHKDGGTKNLTNVKVDELSDYVGKEMADKIVEEATGVTKSYQGLDLEIGGEFHKNLYDKKIVQFVKKFLKDFGVEPQRIKPVGAWEVFDPKTGKATNYFSTEAEAERFVDDWNERIPGSIRDYDQSKGDFWYIDFTPEMREHFINQGIKMTMAPNQMGLLPEQEMRLLA